MNDLPGVDTVPSGSAPDVALLIQTDELLDRIGRRQPTAGDLDDPVLASLAVLAADVDLNPAPVERTRRAALHHGLWPPDVRRPTAEVAHRDLPDPAVPATRPITLPRLRPEDDVPVASPSVLIAAQRTGPGVGTRRAERSQGSARRPASMRLVPGLVAAGAALVLSMTAAAALTRGESVNPAAALVHVVRGLAAEAHTTTPSAPSAPASEGARTPSLGGGPSSPSPGAFLRPSGQVSPSPGLGLIVPPATSADPAPTHSSHPGATAPGGDTGGLPAESAPPTSAHDDPPTSTSTSPITGPTDVARPRPSESSRPGGPNHGSGPAHAPGPPGQPHSEEPRPPTLPGDHARPRFPGAPPVPPGHQAAPAAGPTPEPSSAG
ncbi:MAG: hypothetical protein U0Q19_08300 [Kineosporiaceae bacterium]